MSRSWLSPGRVGWTAMGSNRRLDAMLSVWHEDRPTAEAMLLAACAAADGLPTERERVLEEALREAKKALRANVITWIVLEGALGTPYPDDPRWTPWTRFGERAFRRAGEALEVVRAALSPTKEAPGGE